MGIINLAHSGTFVSRTIHQSDDIVLSQREAVLGQRELPPCDWCGQTFLGNELVQYWYGRSLTMFHLPCFIDRDQRLGKDVSDAARILRGQE